jgi:hypothetical protein
MIYRRFRGPRNLMQTGLQISQECNQQNGILTHPRHRRHLLNTACDPRCTKSQSINGGTQHCGERRGPIRYPPRCILAPIAAVDLWPIMTTRLQ